MVGKNCQSPVNSCSVQDLAGNADTYIRATHGQIFEHSKLYRVCEDIYNSDFSDCYIKVLESYEAKAYIIAAIYRHDQLWGLIAAYQNGEARKWSPEEIKLVTEVGKQLKVAIQQTDLQNQLEQKAAVEKLLSQLSNKILESRDLQSIFHYTCDSIRHFLKCDRVALYQFQENWSGEFIVESMASGWVSLLEAQRKNPAIVENVNSCSVQDLAGKSQLTTRSTDTYIRASRGKIFEHTKLYRVCDNIYNSDFSDCYIKVLESYQAKAYIIVAIYRNDQLWGLIAAYQNSEARQWSSEEIKLVVEVSKQIKVAIQQEDYRLDLEAKNQSLAQAAAQEKALAIAIDKIREAKDIDSIFRSILPNMRGVLNCDRLTVYKFLPDWGGEYIAEAVVSNEWEPWVGVDIKTVWKDTHLQDTKGGRYAKGETFVVNNAYEMGHSQCHVDILAQFNIKSYILAPIFAGEKLWGILCAYEHKEFRTWKENEANLVTQVGTKLGLGIQQANYIKEVVATANAEKTLNLISDKIRQAQSIENIFETVVSDARSLFQCDRVTIMKFNFEGEWNQECLAESVGKEWMPWNTANNNRLFHDDHIHKVRDKLYVQGKPIVTDDIYLPDYPECYVQVLEAGQVKALINAAIYVKGKLWGWLGIFQNDDVRNWQDYEVAISDKLARQIGLAMEQAEYIQGLAQAAVQEKALARAIDKIREAKDIDSIFRNILPNMRGTLNCDRLTVYKFLPDWGGEYIAEAVVSNEHEPWVGVDLKTVWKDTHLQDTKGGRYAKGETFVVNNAYEMGHSQCHVDILAQFKIKSYILAPIFVGEKLWGIICAYEHGAFRTWKQNEVNLVTQLGTQLGLGIQQSKYLETVVQTANAEKTLGVISDKLRQARKLDTIFDTVVFETRSLLKCDRATIIKFNFDGDWNQECLAESVGKEWMPWNSPNKNKLFHDDHIHEVRDKLYRQGEPIVTDDIYVPDYPKCYVEVLEKAQVKALINAAIYVNGELWGWLGIFQNDDVRQWQDYEVNIADKLARQVGLGIEQVEYFAELEAKNQSLAEAAAQEKALAETIDKIRQANDIDSVFRNVLSNIRGVLNCDRLAVYKFLPDWGGIFTAESVINNNWEPWVGVDIKTIWKDTYLQETKGGRYAKGETFVVNNAYQMGHSQCHVDILAQFKIKSYILAPIFVDRQLWGIICAYEHGEFRTWKQNEVNLVSQLGSQLGIGIQQSKYVKQLIQTSKADQTLAIISDRIRQARKLDTIFDSIVFDARSLLKCDRATIMKFNFEGDWNQECLAESVGQEWMPWNTSSSNKLFHDDHIHEVREKLYRQGQPIVADDIYIPDYPECYVEVLEQGQVKAYINASIYVNGKLWGWLGIFQNDDVRTWQDYEVSIADKLARQIGLAIEQVQYFEELEAKNKSLAQAAAQEKALARAIDKVRQAQDLDSIFRNTLPDIRGILKCDRLAIYQFLPDWSGEFIAESVGSDWVPLVGKDIRTVWEDTYLQETQGGRYKEGETLVVDDVYTIGFSQCHLDLLEQFQMKSHVLAPIFVGKKLWGILGAYQNSGPRHWQTNEVDLINRLASQLGLGIQQSEFLTQVQEQEKQLQAAAEREKTAREQLQMEALQMLRALQPSFQGDLTVRAPLSETELGTIADGYNTTINNLRELVKQVKDAAVKVGETSDQSTFSVSQLSTQAQQQVNQLKDALQQLQVMIRATEAVANNAQKVEKAVQDANKTVSAGDSLMERTVDEMLEIRETVSQTAKKIKRLGEASQKISKVVNLIENFATQTNLLALNAAIEATRAGEYGKGFAVVADEVRSLAYQSANATTEIERFVQDIQKEINEVTETMEVGISQVVKGSDLVDETRSSLSAIVAATNEISNLVAGITQTANNQSQQSQSLTSAMTEVSQVAQKTSESSMQISESFRKLLTTSQDLQTSVSKFKVD
ncbi:MAG: GAF domain-containing protein [Xenococcaceae cyanobacterium]